MSLTYGPVKFDVTPQASQVKVYIRNTTTPATLSSPVSVSSAGEVSFTVAEAGSYTIVITTPQVNITKHVYLTTDDFYDITDHRSYSDRDGAGGGGTSNIEVVHIDTADVARPSVDTVFWVSKSGVVPTNKLANDLVFLGTDEEIDTQAPTVPSGVSISNILSDRFTVAWNASTDNVAVTQYQIYVDGVPYSTTASTSSTVLGRTASTLYAAQVRARDAAGNWSSLSAAVSATTTSGGVSYSTQHSIFGSNPYPGTGTSHTDGTPSIWTSASFYKYGSGTGYYPNMRVIGARLWIPAGASGLGSTVTFRGYQLQSDMIAFSAATQEKTVTLGAPGAWTETYFDTPYAVPDIGINTSIAIQFPGAVTAYIRSSNARPSGNFTAALDGTKIVWGGYVVSEKGALFRIGSNAWESPSVGDVGYSIDILVDEGAP